MSSNRSRWDFGGGGGGGGYDQVQQERPYGGMSLISNEVNMTNCYQHCKHFFSIFKSIHFKVLIAYWMMAGYLQDGDRSVEEAYKKGLECLVDLVYNVKILKFLVNDPGMIEFAYSSTNANCRHRGFCLGVDITFLDVLDWELIHLGKILLSKDEKLRMDPKVWPDKYFAASKPTLDSLKALLEKAKNPSVLLLRGFDELSLPNDCFPLHRLKTLTILEISGSTRLTTIPETTFSELIHLKCLNLSNLPIEALPSSFFKILYKLRWLILRGCCKLLSLDFDSRFTLNHYQALEVLDLSHCTALQIFNGLFPRLVVLDLSYTPLHPKHLISSNSIRLCHLYLRGSKIKDLSFCTHSNLFKVLDLSGCSCFTKLDEGLVKNMPYLLKLDLSWTNVKHLPSLANLTRLSVLSLRGLELDSLETLSSLPNQLVELDLTGLKISSSQLELELDFLQFLEDLQILNLSQTSVAKLPYISKLTKLKELLLADCQHLKVVPNLQALTNLETLDLSLPNDSSSNNRQLEIETEGYLSSFPVPSSLRKLVLTNRSGIQKLFPVTTLRGTNVIGWASKLEAQQPPERIPRHVEIHIVSVDDESNGRQPNQLSSLDNVEKVFTKWNALISDIQENLNFSMAREQVEMLHNDSRYIQENIDRLKSSSNWKSSEELLQEILDAATNLSAASFAVDSANFKQLLRIVVKLKLLVPRKLTDDSEALEVTKHKKKKTFFRNSQSKENDVSTAIVKGMQKMESDLLNSYKSLSTIQKKCLLCFSIFPYNEDGDKNTGVWKSIVIKKKILIYWWAGEGFIDPHHEESVVLEPTLKQNPNPDQEVMMSREINAIEQFAATKEVKKPKTIEEIGKQILKVLAEKRFIELVMKKGRESGSCCIHPFVHCFVIKQAKEEGFFDFDQQSGKLAPYFTRSQRACLLNPHYSVPSSCKLWANSSSSPNKLKSFETVKTLFNVNESMIDIKQEWFSKMKHLFVLHLGIWHSENSYLIEISDQKFMEELKKMRQLKLLSLRGLPTIMKLPDSICYLSNLIILDLKECSYLGELPADIGSLKSLTHLDISDCPLLYKLPKGISLLPKLEVLRGFVITDVLQDARNSQVINVSILSRWWEKTKRCGLFCYKNDEACTLRDLLKLERLRELSIVVNISKFPEDEDLQVFKEMNKLCKLKIFWERSISAEKIESATGHESLMGQNIEKLELWCFPHENLPYWLYPRELKNLKKLYIVGGNLRKLHGSGTDESRWNVENLHLKYLRNLNVQWPELEIMFPKLMYLEMFPCDQNVLIPLNKEGVWRSGS